MNRTIAFITLACLVALGIIGYVVLILMSPEKSDQFVSFLLLILGNVTVAAGTLWNLGRTNEKLEVVKRQTNGTLSALVERTDSQSSKILQQAAVIEEYRRKESLNNEQPTA